MRGGPGFGGQNPDFIAEAISIQKIFLIVTKLFESFLLDRQNVAINVFKFNDTPQSFHSPKDTSH